MPKGTGSFRCRKGQAHSGGDPTAADDCLQKEPLGRRTLGQPLSQPNPHTHRMNSSRNDRNQSHNATATWLPLDMPSNSVRRSPRRVRAFRPCGRERAAWWFDQMRRIVETGADFRA